MSKPFGNHIFVKMKDNIIFMTKMFRTRFSICIRSFVKIRLTNNYYRLQKSIIENRYENSGFRENRKGIYRLVKTLILKTINAD